MRGDCPPGGLSLLFALSAHDEASREHIATLLEAVTGRLPLGAPIAGPAARIVRNGSNERHGRVHGSARIESDAWEPITAVHSG